ncbi:hypothetical protein KIN20_021172 [Parelaphostrongylus tenuis]|uniref:Maelstrom domain-containing protein n=1 Tax=Parelaphostrongylus tenuis TaxID=148309 RepID=A0AAD5N4Y0_PARTN|nr:hypothetical protein KIN20_021172 [Parelaphostrongylus tenuis]
MKNFLLYILQGRHLSVLRNDILKGFQFSTLVGPWQIHNDIQRRRAEIHSNETHRIPLTIKSTEMDKRQLVTEILGRCEPNIALQQGIQIGLYTEEMRDLEDCLNRLYVDDKSQILIVQCKY